MLQILGVQGEAVILYREPWTTQEMWYHRLHFTPFRIPLGVHSSSAVRKAGKVRNYRLQTHFAILFMQL